jgi:hypothetical protein
MGRRRKRFAQFNNFVMLPRKMLECKEWKELSASAKLFYIHLKRKFNGLNNTQIRLHYSELYGIRGISSDSTISKAIQELENKGWITRTKKGGLYRHFNEYALTGKYDDHIPNLS